MRASKVVLKESFKVVVLDESNVFVSVLVLGLSEADRSTIKWDCK